jgi:hypothetical protein
MKKLNHTILVVLLVAMTILAACSTPEQTENEDNNLITGNVVAVVNGDEITTQQVEETQALFASIGQDIPKETVLEELINQKLLVQEAKKAGFEFTTEDAEVAIDQQLALQGANLEEYKTQIQAQGIDYEKQLATIKEDLAIQRYLETVFENENFTATEQEAQEIYDAYSAQSSEELPAFQEVKDQILASLQQEKQQQAIGVLIQELKQTATIEYK